MSRRHLGRLVFKAAGPDFESLHPRGPRGRFGKKPAPPVPPAAEAPPKPSDQEWAKAWYQSTTDDEQKFLEGYVSGYDMWANAVLRQYKLPYYLRLGQEKKNLLEKTKRSLALYKSALAKAGKFEPATVYRGVEEWPTFSRQFKVGRRIRLRGFNSTSLDQSVAAEFAGGANTVLAIRIDRGLPVWALEAKGDLAEDQYMLDEQKEILLGHNWEYEITGKRKTEDGRDIWDLKVVVAEGEETGL